MSVSCAAALAVVLVIDKKAGACAGDVDHCGHQIRSSTAEVRFDEDLRGLRVDGVAVGAQASHSAGIPMIQRECAGFNWPPLSIPAVEPVSSSPVAVSRAGPAASVTVGVGHPASATICPSGLPVSHGLASFTPRAASVTVGVGHPASHAVLPSSALIGTLSHCAPSFQSRVVGVGHPVKSVTDVRRTDARRRKRDRPEGVTQGFQVSVYKVDPRACVAARNLLSKHCWRSALRDEVVEGWPQMPLVIKPGAFACRAERLAGARACPNSSIVRPPSES